MSTPEVIIAAHNEAATVGSIIDAARASGVVGRIVVVADACTDTTIGAARRADQLVTIAAGDKGTALAAGLAHVSSPLVLLLDADLVGLKAAHVYALATRPPGAGMVVGLRSNKWLAAPLPSLSGERRLPRDVLERVQLAGAGWATETRINAEVGRLGLPWAHLLLRGVANPSKVLAHPVSFAGEMVGVTAATVANAGALAAYVTHRRGETRTTL